MLNKKLSLAILAAFLVTVLLSLNILADDNTVLYLQGEGTTIKDTSGKNVQIGVYGNTCISTAFKKSGSGSIYFDGDGDYLGIANSEDWNFRTGDFTIDFWFQPTYATGEQWFVSNFNGTSGNAFGIRWYAPGNNIQVNIGPSWEWIAPTVSLSVGTWYHIAVVGQGGTTIKLFLNGAQIGNTMNKNYDIHSTAPLELGRQTGYAYGYPKGYMDEFRITKGKALWTANFTPPIPLPTINFSANKDLLNNGESATLTWSTADASGCALQYNNTTQGLELNGNTTVTPNAPTTYTLIAGSPGGTTYKELNVKVLNGYTTTGPFTVATKVGIGVMNPQNALDVNGTIKAKEVQVTLNNWPDYVFDTDYELRSLKNLETYIQQNHCLPGMPAAGELEQQGVSVAEILKKQMLKIEELTLYIIQLQKQIESLKKE